MVKTADEIEKEHVPVNKRINEIVGELYDSLRAHEGQAKRKAKHIEDMKASHEQKIKKKDDEHEEDMKKKNEKINELEEELMSWRSKPVQEAAELVEQRALVNTHEQAAKQAKKTCEELAQKNSGLEAALEEAQKKARLYDAMMAVGNGNKRHRTAAPSAASDTPETQPAATPARQHAASLLSLGDTTSVGPVGQL